MEHTLWVEAYRPKTISDCILPENTKKIFSKFVEEKSVLNLLLSGASGTGKTTVARALMYEIDADYILINGSKDGNIDTLRTYIADFASKVSLGGGRKYVILDEADHLSHATQPALRNFMEEFSRNCGFILTCNFRNKIIDPLQGRCSLIEFKSPIGDERKVLIKAAFVSFKELLTKEKVEYSDVALLKHINKYFPNLRKALNELQSYSKRGPIDEGILGLSSDKNIDELVAILKEKKFAEMRKWVAAHADIEFSALIGMILSQEDKIKKESLPQLILHLNEYQYKSYFIINQEINTASCLLEVMRDVVFL